MSEPQFMFKIIVAGQSATGKTCLIHRFVDGKFIRDTKSSIGVDFSVKNVTINLEEQEIKTAVQVWDMAGESRFRDILQYYCAGTQGIILVFDCTIPETMYALIEWLEILHQHIPLKTPIFLVSAKNDLESKTTDGEIEKFVALRNFEQWFKTSSFSGDRVDEVFLELTRLVAKKFLDNK